MRASGRQLGWFIALWLGGVSVVTLIGLIIRWLLNP